MNKNAKIILYILLGIMIVGIVFVIIKFILFYLNAKKALSYAFVNTLECGQKKCPATPAELKEMSIYPKTIWSKLYNINVAKYCSFLIYAIADAAENNTSPVYPNTLTLIKEFYDNPADPVFGALLQDKNDPNVLWLVFRGTQTPGEWSQDLKYNQNNMLNNQKSKQKPFNITNSSTTTPKVHEGFLDAYMNFRTQLFSQLQKYKPLSTNIIVSGHSLGAAVSTLVGIDLHQSGHKKSVVYNFASPKVGNPDFADLVNKSGMPLYRIVNTEDLIPTLPLSVSPNFSDAYNIDIYQHCGILKPVTFNRLSIINNHLIPGYMESLSKNIDVCNNVYK